MNLKTINVVMFLSGVILLYSGIKGYKPQSVLAWALGGKKPTGWGSSDSNGQSGSDSGNPNDLGDGANVPPGGYPDTIPRTYDGNGFPQPASVTNPTAGGVVSV